MRNLLKDSSLLLIIPFLSAAALRGAYSLQATTSPPPIELAGVGKRGTTMITTYAGVQASVAYSMLEKKLDITWWRDFPLQQRREMSSQIEPTSMWPTEVCSFGPNRLCVAGKNVKNQTVIRMLEFSSVETLEEPTPPTYPDTFIPVTTVTTIFSGNVVGKRIVRTMFKNHGASNKLFVEFNDSRDLYELNVDSGVLTLILSASSEPLLMKDYVDRASWNHTALGYLYCFAMSVNDNGLPESFILVDSNRDGVLDLGSTMHLVGDQWRLTFTDQSLFQGAY